MEIGAAARIIARTVAGVALPVPRVARFRPEDPLRVLVVRPDRLGDVILSTPVFEAIKSAFPKAKLTVWVSELVRPLIEGNAFVDQVVTWKTGASEGRGFRALVHEIESHSFDLAVVLKTERRIGWVLVAAGVPVRIGPWSKPHSFLTFNFGLRQHRSRVEKHEADYNLELLERAGIQPGASRGLATRIFLSDQVRQDAKRWLEGSGWVAGAGLVVVHPGMGGSALNWPEDHYLELIRELSGSGAFVVVTGGNSEEALLERFRQGLWKSAENVAFYGGKSAGSIDFLAGLFSWASVVVAPSTGPLHVAVALGTPVVTFFPPIRVQSAKRWGPYVADPAQARVLVPEQPCGEVYTCGKSCGLSDSCMRSLPVEQALKYTREYLKRVTG